MNTLLLKTMSGARRNGSAVVMGSVTAIMVALGVGTVYLPFIADRDKIRGLDEDGSFSSAKQREYERAVREMAMVDHPTRQQPVEVEYQSMERGIRQSNSMWARMNQNQERR